MLLDRSHGARGARRDRRRRRSPPRTARSSRCGIRSFSLRAQRRAVVEVAAAIPFAVPGLALQRGLRAAACMRRQRSRVARRRAARRNGAKCGESREQEPAQPDALALARLRRPGSCRRSSRRCRSAAGRGAGRRGCGRAPARSARTGSPASSETVGWKKRSCSPGAAAGLRGTATVSSSTAVSPVAST